MHQFFVDNSQITDGIVCIAGADYNHARNVLRIKPGEQIRISTQDGISYYARLTGYSQKEALAQIEQEDTRGTELPVDVTLFQGLPKGDRMETIIQKAVELGVCEVVPVAMKHCVVKLDERKAEARLRRWQAIAESAAKQSKRTRIPQIRMPVSWQEALSQAKMLDITLVPYENEQGMQGTKKAIGSIRSGQTVGIIIGPEGGFAPEEIAQVPTDEPDIPADAAGAQESGTEPSGRMCRISLGRRILRTETAGPAALAMLIYELEE